MRIICILRSSRRRAALLAAAFAAFLACGIPRVQAQTYAYTVSVSNPSDIAYYIPTTFNGYSTESGSIETNSSGGYFWAATNTQIVCLFTNIGYTSMRIGGNSADEDVNTNPPQAALDTYRGFLQATHMATIWTLDYESEAAFPLTNGTVARRVMDTYPMGFGPSNVMWFDLGNEPDDYSDWNETNWLPAWTSDAVDVENVNSGDVALGAPDMSNNGLEYEKFFGQNLDNTYDGGSLVKYITYHYSIMSSADVSSAGDDSNMCQMILSSNLDWATGSGKTNFQYIDTQLSGDTADGDCQGYAITEQNPFDGAGDGDSKLTGNSFGYALFELDALNWFSHNGVNANHEYGCIGLYPYSTGKHAAYHTDSSGNYYAYPLAYGNKAFQITQSGGNAAAGVVAETISNPNALNVTSYATSCGNVIYVTIINKEFGPGAVEATATVGVSNSAWAGSDVYVMYLTTANSDITNQTATLGGDTLDGQHAWSGTWTALGALTNGQCVVPVPAASAAIVRILAISPPMIVQDLPPQISLTPGQTYQYSIGAESDLPLSYQWYQGGTLVIGQTNAAYTVTAGDLGSQASYYVVVSNTFGSVTSLVSTLTVIAPPTNSYAGTIEDLNPVAYWPLQETNAPAPATIETNYGSLGALGTAYYAATNPADVQFGQAGLPVGNDVSVKFLASSAVTPDSFAFVPRISPAVTFKPPLTLELWLNGDTPSSKSSANTEDVLGEGGSGLDSPPSDGNYGGVRMSWVYDSSTAGPAVALLPSSGSGGTIGDWEFPVAAGDQWYHYVVTYDGTNFITYVNGVEQGTNAFAMAPDTWSPLTIGCGRWQATDTRAFNGRETEVAVYTNVLSVSRITSHYLAGITAGSNYAQTILNDNPLLYYRMNCPGYTNPSALSSPTALNYGSDGVNGLYLPGTVPGEVAGPPIAGLNSRAAGINGITSCISVGYDPSLNPTGTQPFTAMAWFKSNPSDGRMQTIMSHGGNTSWALNLVGTNGTVSWSSGAGSVTSTDIFNDGNWHFAAGVYDGANNYLYVDGALNNFSAATGSATGNTSDGVFLGGDPDFTLAGVKERYFAGAIAQAAFFTNALSAGQIQAIYVSAITPPPEMLGFTNTGNSQVELSWNFGTLQTATNVAGPYNDMTNASSPWTIPTTNSQQFFRLREN
ncbi:MAG TPA: LamG-like jellyroll fold domain-containing protein [Candidatus Sulfotelmatobacter sp.]|nr:LamG-like jellyroll fold domain-containing protein [Candidatus Sulfotelmatobacter sp.]